jgi:hypothetical protein
LLVRKSRLIEYLEFLIPRLESDVAKDKKGI